MATRGSENAVGIPREAPSNEIAHIHLLLNGAMRKLVKSRTWLDHKDRAKWSKSGAKIPVQGAQALMLRLCTIFNSIFPRVIRSI